MSVNSEEVWFSCLFVLLILQLFAPIYNFFIFHISKKERDNNQDSNIVLENYPPVMLVIPTYNDGTTIEESLNEVEKIDYQNLNVLIINDCSSDDTHEKVESWITSDRRFKYKLISLPTNSGTKALALNRSIDHFDDGLIVITDGDTFLHKDAIKKLVTLKISKGENCSTVSGKILIRDEDVTDFIGTIQKYEHDYLYMHTKLFQSYYGGVVVSSGALLLLEKKDILTHGNFDDDVLVEDIVWSCGQITKFRKTSAYCHDAIAFTSPQPSAKALLNQRERWAYGLYEVLQKKYYCIPKTVADFIVFTRILLIFPRKLVYFLLLSSLFINLQSLIYIVPIFLLMVALWDLQIVVLTRRSKLIEGCTKSKLGLVSIIMSIRLLVFIANTRVLFQVLTNKPKTWKTR